MKHLHSKHNSVVWNYVVTGMIFLSAVGIWWQHTTQKVNAQAVGSTHLQGINDFNCSITFPVGITDHVEVAGDKYTRFNNIDLMIYSQQGGSFRLRGPDITSEVSGVIGAGDSEVVSVNLTNGDGLKRIRLEIDDSPEFCNNNGDIYLDQTPPTVATPQLPTGGIVIEGPADIDFSWLTSVDSLVGFDHYQLFVSPNISFPPDNTYTVDNLATNGVTLTDPIYLAGVQYWRVSASDLLGNTSYSSLLEFRYNRRDTWLGGPVCGDNKREGSEECDDGNYTNGDGCNSSCKIETMPVCGDNEKEGSEECDDGNLTNGDGCSDECIIEIPLPVVCGDNNPEGDEECDDGNLTNGDGCSDECTIETNEVCGDGTATPGEICGEPSLPVCPSGDVCNSCLCEPETLEGCGDQVLQANEECEQIGPNIQYKGSVPSPLRDISFCDTDTCRIEGYCGDGYADTVGLYGPREECDDGGNDNFDGCSSTCYIEAVYQPVCGNGVKEIGEACDDGNNNNDDNCLNSCKEPGTQENAFCGDGIVNQQNEECDDGNGVNGDGCNNFCKSEGVIIIKIKKHDGDDDGSTPPVFTNDQPTEPDFGVQGGILANKDLGHGTADEEGELGSSDADEPPLTEEEQLRLRELKQKVAQHGLYLCWGLAYDIETHLVWHKLACYMEPRLIGDIIFHKDDWSAKLEDGIYVQRNQQQQQ